MKKKCFAKYLAEHWVYSLMIPAALTAGVCYASLVAEVSTEAQVPFLATGGFIGNLIIWWAAWRSMPDDAAIPAEPRKQMIIIADDHVTFRHAVSIAKRVGSLPTEPNANRCVASVITDSEGAEAIRETGATVEDEVQFAVDD